MNATNPDTGQSRRLLEGGRSPRREFFERVLVLVAVVAAVGLLLALLWQSTEVILLIFAGLLVAIVLDGLAGLVSKYTSLSKLWALTLVLIAILGFITALVWLFLPSLEEQFVQISNTIPEIAAQIRRSFQQSAAGRWIVEQLFAEPTRYSNRSSNVLGQITGFFSSFLGASVNVAIVLVSGVYFAYSPSLYYEGAVKLFPKRCHARLREVLDTVGYNLRRWLIGRFAVMTINGGLTTLGLWMLGVPMAVPLGLIAGIFNFIPNIGPFLGAIPAVLIALTQSPMQALYTAIMYLAIQTLEGFLLTPLVQQRAVSLPPVAVISAQLLLGVLFGFLGLLLAVPIVAVVFVLVKMLYVEDILGNEVEVKGENDVE
ncbi:MAG TPA: AI-2E family transporter [Pyrinomonadaceae bacterium]